MKNQKTNIAAVLASYATLKTLFDAEKYQNIYQILQEFIKYIIIKDSLHSVTAQEMKNRLNDLFGFDLPESVVKASLRHMDSVTLKEGNFHADIQDIKNDELFNNTMHLANEDNSSVFDKLLEYAQSKNNSTKVDAEKLSQSLISFLLDDQYHNTENPYIDLVSEFILINENDTKIQTDLNAIREGSILHIGLTNNIHDTGSLSKPLTIFLGTEVLFSLYGLNGEIYQKIAMDFLNQVRSANTKEQKIVLRYFTETKKEVDAYFGSARAIVEKKMRFFIDKPAMRFITNGCETANDVTVKESDFFYKLQYQYGVTEDKKKDYYKQEDSKYNLEELSDNEDSFESLRFISHINKLRKGKIFKDILESEYIYVTNATETLKMSNNQTSKLRTEQKTEYVCDFAVSVEKITNFLWFKLCKGFGKSDYPDNVNVVLRARMILSANVAKNVAKSYKTAQQEFSNGKINEQQLALRVIALRNKKDLPEDLRNDEIESNLNFTDEYFYKIEEELSSNKKALQEKETILNEMKEEGKRAMTEKDDIIRKIETDNNILKARLAEFEKRDADINRKRKRRSKIFRRLLKVLFGIALLGVILFISFLFAGWFESNVPVVVGVIVNAGCILSFIFQIIEKVKKSHKNENSAD